MVRFGVMLVGPTLGGKTARETQREFLANWPMAVVATEIWCGVWE